MALNDLKPSNESIMEVLHPVSGEAMTDAKGKKYTITLIGADSDKYQAMFKRGMEKSLNRKGKVDLEESSKRGIEILAKCVSDCYLEFEDGKPVDCDFESMMKVFTEFKWLKEQAEAFVQDRANFIKG